MCSFLSCLFGSEPRPGPGACLFPFLSCLFGSEHADAGAGAFD